MDGLEQIDVVTGEVSPASMPPEIAKAIIEVAGKVKQIGSDERNQHGGYTYVSVDKLYDIIGKLMSAAGLALLVDETSSEVRESRRTDDRGNEKISAWLFMRYSLSFMHESGALSPPMRRSCALPISGPQAFGAAQSYTEKQFLRQVFKVPTGEKDADDIAQDGVAPTRREHAIAARTVPRAAPASVGVAAEPSFAHASPKALFNTMYKAVEGVTTLAALDAMHASKDWEDMVAAVGLTAEGKMALDRLEKMVEGKRDYFLAGV